MNKQKGCGTPVRTQIRKGDKLNCGDIRNGMTVFCSKCSEIGARR